MLSEWHECRVSERLCSLGSMAVAWQGTRKVAVPTTVISSLHGDPTGTTHPYIGPYHLRIDLYLHKPAGLKLDYK